MKNILTKQKTGMAVLLLLCVIGFTQCKKSSSPAPAPDNNGGSNNGGGNTPAGPSVYVAGFEYDASGTVATAEYWKDGVAVKLSDGKNINLATSIFIAGSDIYVAGAEIISGKSTAKYWKNGTAVNLPDNNSAVGNSIAVNGSNVYVCGYQQNANGTTTPLYWKNGVLVNLPTGDASLVGEAINMTISNGDVYIAGIVTSAGNTNGAYWKNGVLAKVGGTATSSATSIWVDQLNHVYVAGNIGLIGPGIDHGEYWIDGGLANLYDGTNNCTAVSVKVNGGSTYIGGYTNSGGRQYAAYWKNGAITRISDGTVDTEVVGIDVYGNDVYNAGFVTKANSSHAPVYWKNNIMVTLTGVVGSSEGQALCVVVK